jgi:hypothetical protein
VTQDWHSRSWGDTLVEDVELLLRDLCVGWGYCNYSVFADDLLAQGDGVVTAEAVARATLSAEGVVDSFTARAMERLFFYRYGAASIREADFPPAGRLPYSVAPDPLDPEPPDAVLAVARDLMTRLAKATGDTSATEVEPTLPPLDPDDFKRSLERARRVAGFTVGPREEENARLDIKALIVLHERITGKYWNRDPEDRRKLGLGNRPGTLAK